MNVCVYMQPLICSSSVLHYVSLCVYVVCSSQPDAEQPEVDEEGYSIRPQDADIL